MRHRMGIASYTGIGGNNSPVLLDNKGKINKIFAKDVLKTYFEHWGGFDYTISDEEIKVGIEPAYFGEDLLIVAICKDKRFSYIQTGHAFGYWGSGIRSKTKYYKDYKKNCKFVKFVDKWHDLLFNK